MSTSSIQCENKCTFQFNGVGCNEKKLAGVFCRHHLQLVCVQQRICEMFSTTSIAMDQQESLAFAAFFLVLERKSGGQLIQSLRQNHPEINEIINEYEILSRPDPSF
jgi:hypothetical protein